MAYEQDKQELCRRYPSMEDHIVTFFAAMEGGFWEGAALKVSDLARSGTTGLALAGELMAVTDPARS